MVLHCWLGLKHSSPGQTAGQQWYSVPSFSPSPPKIEEELARITVSVLHLPASCLILLSFRGTVYKTSDENYIQSLPLFILEKRRGPHHSIPELKGQLLRECMLSLYKETQEKDKGQQIKFVPREVSAQYEK